MKDDIIKWAMLIGIAGIVFYIVAPKYDIRVDGNTIVRLNKITGTASVYIARGEGWAALE